MSTDVLYRVPGFLSPRSVQYLDNLLMAGWREDQFARFKEDLPRFESASIKMPYEEALESMVNVPDEAHGPFLQGLNSHIRAVARAERLEELQRKAKTNDKESMAAQTMLNAIDPVTTDGENLQTASIHFHVQDAKNEVQVTRGSPKSK